MLASLGNCHVFLRAAAPFCTPISNKKKFQLHHVIPVLAPPVFLAIMAFDRYWVLMAPEFWKANSQILEMRETLKLLPGFIYLFVWIARNTHLCKKTMKKNDLFNQNREWTGRGIHLLVLNKGTLRDWCYLQGKVLCDYFVIIFGTIDMSLIIS